VPFRILCGPTPDGAAQEVALSARAAGYLSLVFGGVGAVVWFAMPDQLWPQRTIFVLTLAFAAAACFDRARFPGEARTETTMGPAGDVLIGFQARVLSRTPLRVEARGSVWSARLVGEPPLTQPAFLEIVGRDGLTLLVRRPEEAANHG
jgi:membrane protein implicated in regulation of membrane protease activity